ncbi:MAG TPA: ATP-grasp domain-containing protein [Ktedonobacteraceae bacterium]|nr:ATP-grasp domain-containing protein [Ktedonobacteraceae bacterium]
MNNSRQSLSPAEAHPSSLTGDERSGDTSFAKRNGPFDALVLDANLRQSLVSVRSLGRRGMRVAALEVESLAASVPTFSSRWCRQAFVAPSYEQAPEPYLHYLEQLLDSTQVRVLITSSDGTLAVLRQHREQIERRARIALASESALAIAINKDRTLEIARELGLGIPQGIHVESISDVPDALRDVGLPAVVKPVESWLWGGNQESERLVSKLVTTPDEARSAVEELTRLGGTVLFQQFLSGRREAVNLLYAHGEFYARFAQWAKRTQPPLGGTSVYRQSIAVPQDIGDQSERLIRAIDLEGYSEVEFRRDATGKPYLMEINPRLSASVEVAVRAGVDFPHLLYQWANGDPIDRVTSYRTGGWMRYLEGDFLTTVQSITQRGRPGVTPPGRAIFEFLTSFFVPAHYDYLNWQDLRPGLAATKKFSGSMVQRLRKLASRRP